MTAVLDARPADLASAERLFENWIGFDIHGAAPRRLKEFLVTRASHLGFTSVSSYLDALPPKRPTTEEAQRLVDMVTNGLTAFWRDPQQLEALGSLLAQLHERYNRPLDVWCAGCATGEEAYSVAIAARELDVPVRVVGTDVNTGYLADARCADFDDWSLRRVPPERRERWFAPRNHRWALDREIASMVEFRHHNLLEMPIVPTSGKWDAILCRNVIIYLTPDAVDRILTRFAGSIAEDGYLLLGSSEQIGHGFTSFRAVRRGPTFVYRSVAVDPGTSFPLPSLGYAASPEPTLDEKTIGFSEDDAVPKLLRSAVGHDHDAAVACYEAASGYDPFAPEVYALLGSLLRDVGAVERAVQAFGKVLFLDPDNWWAAARRAECYESMGDHVEAHRHFRIVLEGLAATDGSPFDDLPGVPMFQNLAHRRDAERERAVKALDRLVGGA